jgi:putative CocE/NonD family hydrolase
MSLGLDWGVRIPLRDGVTLSASLYLPDVTSPPAPAIVTITPYTADFSHERGTWFAAHGLPVLIVESRGRGNSDGEFRPYIQEAEDGYDIVEWVARQAYCDGRVVMQGGSYAGHAQWAAARERPPSLAAIAPTASPYIGLDFPMRNNIRYPYTVQWIAFTSGKTSQSRIFFDQAFWSERFHAWRRSGRPFRELDRQIWRQEPLFQTWTDHPEPDAYWDAYNPTIDDYSGIDIPVLTITGAYDDDQPGALEHYRLHRRHASGEAGARHHLVIGPWDHAGTARPRAAFGGLTFGAESLVDIFRLHLDWYRWVLSDGPRPAFLQKRVAYYVTGSERWRYVDRLSQATGSRKLLWLSSHGAADDVFASGALSEGPGSGGPDAYVYDLSEADTPEARAEARTDGASLTDQSVLLALKGKALVYHSPPFEEDVEITGFFRLEAWLSIDRRDADIYVSLHDIGPDGESVRLSTDAMRARYRKGLRTPVLVESAAPELYDFSRFTFVSRLVRRGHRLRLVIASMGRLVDSVFAEKNCGSGGPVADETAADAGPITVRLFHDDHHPSRLHVPIGAERGRE